MINVVLLETDFQVYTLWKNNAIATITDKALSILYGPGFPFLQFLSIFQKE